MDNEIYASWRHEAESAQTRVSWDAISDAHAIPR